jgi:adenylyltransferase/sulfurtransferase
MKAVEATAQPPALAAAQALVVGAGSLGGAASAALARAGVGRIGLVDEAFADAEAARLGLLNPAIQAEPYPAILDASNALAILEGHDLVVDCSDDRATRTLLAESCLELGLPLVTGGLSGSSGWAAVMVPGSACGRCLQAHLTRGEGDRASPVSNALAGVIGSLQGLEAIKLVTGTGRSLAGRVLVVEGLIPSVDVEEIPRRPTCELCGEAMA